jgi:TatD DNase family protein
MNTNTSAPRSKWIGRQCERARYKGVADRTEVGSLHLPALAIAVPRLLPTVGSGEDGCCSTDSEDPDPTDMDQMPRPRALPAYTVPWADLPAGSLFDSHLHLDLLSRRLGAGRASLQRLVARDPLVPWRAFGGCVANFIRPEDWQEGLGPGLRAAAEEERVHLAVGCHPHWAAGCDSVSLAGLEAAARELGHRLVAIGECGLDYSKNNDVPHQRQIRVFREQVELALRLHLPLVLHIRDAEEEGLEVLRAAGLPPHWPVHRHCFTGDWSTAAAWLELYPGSRLGVTAAVTHPNRRAIHDWVRQAPLDRILLETDAPYFTPWTKGRNSALPGDVAHVAGQVAALKGVSIQEVLMANLVSVKHVYGVGPSLEKRVRDDEGVEVVRAKFK